MHTEHKRLFTFICHKVNVNIILTCESVTILCSSLTVLRLINVISEKFNIIKQIHRSFAEEIVFGFLFILTYCLSVCLRDLEYYVFAFVWQCSSLFI